MDMKQIVFDFNFHFLSTCKLVIFTSQIWMKVINEEDVEQMLEISSCHLVPT